MNVKTHHTLEELKTLYRSEKNAKLAQRIHGLYLASKGLTCPQIMNITGVARRTIQQWVHKYNKQEIAGLKDKSRPGGNPETQRQVGFLRLGEPRGDRRI